jgi:hypothetical protein
VLAYIFFSRFEILSWVKVIITLGLQEKIKAGQKARN